MALQEHPRFSGEKTLQDKKSSVEVKKHFPISLNFFSRMHELILPDIDIPVTPLKSAI